MSVSVLGFRLRAEGYHSWLLGFGSGWFWGVARYLVPLVLSQSCSEPQSWSWFLVLVLAFSVSHLGPKHYFSSSFGSGWFVKRAVLVHVWSLALRLCPDQQNNYCKFVPANKNDTLLI